MSAPLGSACWFSLALVLVACQASPSDDLSTTRMAPEPEVVTSRPTPRGKPSAPVDVSLTTRALGGGEHEVTLIARPTRDVPALELMVDGRSERLGAVSAGEQRTMTAHIRLGDQAGRDIVAGAATGLGNRRRSRAVTARIGTPAAVAKPLPVQIIQLEDGTELAEVRP